MSVAFSLSSVLFNCSNTLFVWINETGSLYSNAGSILIIWNFCISNRGSLKEMGVADTKAFSLNKKKSSNGRVISDL